MPSKVKEGEKSIKKLNLNLNKKKTYKGIFRTEKRSDTTHYSSESY
jgi:hypothetical protein